MTEFKFYQDSKCTIWHRQMFTVEAKTEEEARAIVEAKCKDDYIDEVESSQIVATNSEYLFNTVTNLHLEENGECSTIETYTEDGDFVCGNGIS